MGAPEPGMQAAEQPAAETLLTALKTINAAERRKHASVLNYWLSIRGNREFPPLHDFDPLEISDFGQCSMLAELIGSGHDADIRHLGEALQAEGTFERIIDAPNPSILASIARKLPIVTISRDFLAFEDHFSTANGATRCWVTLLPLSSSGAWVDYVYAFVSVERRSANAAEAIEAAAEQVPVDQIEDNAESVAVKAAEEAEVPVEIVAEQAPAEPADVAAAGSGPGFAKIFEGFAGLAGFYGQSVKPRSVVEYDVPASEAGVEPAPAEPQVVEPEAMELGAAEPEVAEPEVVEPEVVEPAAIEPVAFDPEAVGAEPAGTPVAEGSLQHKLTEVRARADEARAAKLRAEAALVEGLGAAHDFAIDAEDSPEEYLRLVEERGLKIQLRAPMAPVVRLAFDGQCDEATIVEMEAVLAWALKQELPRGALAGRIAEAGGLAGILREARAA